MSAGAAYIITDILAGNTDTKVNPFWGKWAIYDGGTRRPAAYKTGTTSDNRDVAAYGYLAPPTDKKAPALAVGVWMGNSDNSPNDGKLSLDTSAPLWSAILTEVSKGTDRPVQAAAGGAQDRHRRRVHRPQARPVHDQDGQGVLPARDRPDREGDVPDRAPRSTPRAACCGRTAASGPKVTRGFFNLSEVETNFPNWQKANLAWGARAARGSGVGGGPKGTRTAYFYNGAFAPFGRTWGAPFMPRDEVPALHAAGLLRSVRDPRPARAATVLRPAADRSGRRRRPTKTPRPRSTPKPH